MDNTTTSTIIACLFEANCIRSVWWFLLMPITVWLVILWLVVVTLKRTSPKHPEPTPSATAGSNSPPPTLATADSAQLATLSAQVAAMALPPFWPDNPEAWFTNIESQFVMSNTTNEATKFQKVICKLPPGISDKIIHITSKPHFEPGDYTRLKEAILSSFKKSRTKRWGELVKLSCEPNLKPTEILNKMRSLTLSTNPDDCIHLQPEDFKVHFIQALPAHMQGLFSVIAKNCSIDELAQQADTFIEATPTPPHPNVSAIEQTTQSDPQPSETTQQAQPVPVVDAIARNRGRARGNYRNQSDRRNREQNRSQPQTRDNQLCYYHTRFGDQARRCSGSPCPKNF